MKKTLSDLRASVWVVMTCFAVYTLLSFSRNAYTAALAGIINDGIFTKTAGGTINSSFYITYSLAQIFGSFYVDRVSPFKLVGFAIVGTILSNVIMELFPTFTVILIARSFSGLVQFGVWPALLKIITEYICPEHRRKSLYIMPLGYSAGAILSFLLAAVVLKYGSWQNLFTLTYVFLTVIFVVFCLVIRYAEKKAKPMVRPAAQTAAAAEAAGEKVSMWQIIRSSGTIMIFISAFLTSLFAAGIESWMPTLLMESYQLTPSFSSILSTIGVCAKLLAVFCMVLIYPKFVKNQAAATGIFLALMLPLLATLIFVGKIPLLLIILVVVLLYAFRGTVSQFFTTEIPTGYSRYNRIGMMAGLINVASCSGYMVEGTIYGYTADCWGWNTTVMIWAVLAFTAMATIFSIVPVWRKFTKASDTDA